MFGFRRIEAKGGRRAQLQSFNLAKVGPKHLTDIYLLSLAVANRGCLITFDDLPDPAILAAGIVEDLKATLDQFALIAADLARNPKSY